MHTQMGPVSHLNLRYSPSYFLFELKPEVAGFGLGFGYRRPVVAHVFILACNLTDKAAITFINIDYEYFFCHIHSSPLNQALKRSPEAGLYSLLNASG